MDNIDKILSRYSSFSRWGSSLIDFFC